MIKNKILEKIVLPTGDAFLGTSFMRSLKEVRAHESLNEEELKRLQKKKLSKLLTFALHEVPFYRELALEQETEPMMQLKRFPILTKQMLRKNTEKLLTVNERKLIKNCTSGSSGVQTCIWISRRELSYQQATQTRWWEWAGYNLGDPIVQTGMTPNRGFIKKIKDVLLSTYYLSAFAHCEKDIINAFMWQQNQSKPCVLGGYASSLFIMSKIAKKNNINLKFKTAIAWGDKVFNHYGKNIKNVFKCELYETYGCSEGLMIAAQKDLPYLYIMAPNVVMEIVDSEGRDVPDGELGHVLITSLNSYSMPLIRYKVGDLAIKLPRIKYPSKRDLSYPLLEKVIGRDTDIVHTRFGKYMTVHSFTGIFEHIPEIEQFCVIQRKLDGIEIQYIPRDTLKKETLLEVKNKILIFLGDKNFSITFKEVSVVKPTKSGKPQLVVSELSNPSEKC